MGQIHLYTKTRIQSTYKKSLRREDVNVIRHKHKGCCTSLCSFSGEGHSFQNDIPTFFFFFPKRDLLLMKTSRITQKSTQGMSWISWNIESCISSSTLFYRWVDLLRFGIKSFMCTKAELQQFIWSWSKTPWTMVNHQESGNIKYKIRVKVETQQSKHFC